jgi:hypothetical protein
MGIQNPMGSGSGLKFYPWVWVRMWFLTQINFVMGQVFAPPDPNLIHYHPYIVQLKVNDWN